MRVSVRRSQVAKSGLLGKSREYCAEIRVTELSEEEKSLITTYGDESLLTRGKVLHHDVKNEHLEGFLAEVKAPSVEAAEEAINTILGVLGNQVARLRAMGGFGGEQLIDL